MEESIDLLGYKKDEPIYIRPVYARDAENDPEVYKVAKPPTYYVVDGNHRVNWWKEHEAHPARPAKIKCVVFKGKVYPHEFVIISNSPQQVNGVELEKDDEEVLSWGLNALHDEGAVHSTDLEKVRFCILLAGLTISRSSNIWINTKRASWKGWWGTILLRVLWRLWYV